MPAGSQGPGPARGLLQGKPAWTLVLVPEEKIQNKVTSTEQVPTPLSRECRSAALTDGQSEGRVVPTMCREGFLCGQLWGRAQQLCPGPSRRWRQRPSLGHCTIQRPPSVSPPLRHYLGWDGGSVRCGLQGPEPSVTSLASAQTGQDGWGGRGHGLCNLSSHAVLSEN